MDRPHSAPSPERRRFVRPHGRCWSRSNRRRCASSCSRTSADSNRPTRPRTGSTRTLPAKNTLTAADADLVEAELPRKARSDRVGVRRLVMNSPRPQRRHWGRVEHSQLRPESRSSLNGRRSAAAPIILPRPLGAPSSRCGKDHSPARQGALQVRRHAALRRLRPHADRSPSHSLCPAARARPQGQRRIHGPGLPPPSSRSAPLWR